MKERREAKALLARVFGCSPDSDAMRILDEEFHVIESWAGGQITDADLARKFRAAAELAGVSLPNAEQRYERSEPPNDTLRVLSLLTAEAAARDRLVRRFRRERLSDSLIQPEAVDGWIKAQLIRDEASTLPAGHPDAETEFISYLTAASDRVQHLPIPAPGVLNSLRIIGNSLARGYDWHPAAAVVFILTGQPYEIPRVRIKQTEMFGSVPWQRIHLDVSPTVTPTDLANIYRRARAALKPPRQHRSKRSTVALVEFVRLRLPAPWREIMAAWNAAQREAKLDDLVYPDAQVSNFKRDYERALRIATTC